MSYSHWVVGTSYVFVIIMKSRNICVMAFYCVERSTFLVVCSSTTELRAGDVSRTASRGGPLTHCRDTVSTRILGSTLPLPLLPPCRCRCRRRRREFGCWVSVPAAAMGPCQRAQIERTGSSSSPLYSCLFRVTCQPTDAALFICHWRTRSSRFRRVHQ